MGPPGCRSLSLAAAVAALAALAAQWRALQPYATPLAELAQAKALFLDGVRGGSSSAGAAAADAVPRAMLLVLFDDLGLGDLGLGDLGLGNLGCSASASAGHRRRVAIATPRIDELASGGVLLSRFYAGSSVCTPSRAALFTGRIAPRTGAGSVVYFPPGHPATWATRALGHAPSLLPDELTFAEALSAAGWRASLVGKWHLTSSATSGLPSDFGFGSHFGALYSNDMEPFVYLRDGQLAEASPDQALSTEAYTLEAVSQIEAAYVAGEPVGGGPLALVVAYHAPHDPLYVRSSLLGRSDAGLYGDVVEEVCTTMHLMLAQKVSTKAGDCSWTGAWGGCGTRWSGSGWGTTR